MKAVVLERPIEAKELKVEEVPSPKIKPGWVLIQIKAFGINRSELFTRQGHSPSVQLPRILGIECVGLVADPGDSNLHKGQKVISMMGGLGRDFDGSYAQYVLIPKEQVYPVDIDISWEELAAIPEMYYTAWGSLVDTLKLQPGETLLIRGGTSSVGLAATQIASAMGATVIATTRKSEESMVPISQGAKALLIDDDTFLEQAKKIMPDGADKILELVGITTLDSSFSVLKRGGTLCMTGILGGVWELQNFAPMDYIPSGSYFTIFDSQTVYQSSLDAMFRFLKTHGIRPRVAKVFSLDGIAQAHKLMESNGANGKIVVVNQ